MATGFKKHADIAGIKKMQTYPPGNLHIPRKWHFEDDFPFPKVGYVSSLEGTWRIIPVSKWLMTIDSKSPK